MELIVEGNTDLLPPWAKIKYRLPFIDCTVIDIDNCNAKHLHNKRGIVMHNCTTINTQLNRARELVHCQRQGLSGKGITIAVLDTGVCQNRDFDNRLVAFKDFVAGKTAPYDDNGHGTHVCGILCGNGLPSKGKYEGIAPEANLVMLKTLNSDGRGNSADVLAGMQWIADNYKKYNIRIVNMSIGADIASTNDPLVRAADMLWKIGIVVVAAAGNNGPAPCTISSPGISRRIITVGSSEDSENSYSGRGPTRECIIKPDIVAPGHKITSCLCGNSSQYKALSGTSMSTPIVSGAVALLLEKAPKLTPDDVKYMLKISSTDMNYPQNRQGWGLLNIAKLLSQEVIYVR